MKSLLMIGLLAAAPVVFAQPPSPPLQPVSRVVHGKVMEVKNVKSYTYLLLKTQNGETWAAVNQVAVKKGDEVTIEDVSVMTNFKSQTLNRTFPKILFGTIGNTSLLNPHAMTGMPGAQPPQQVALGNIHVAKAVGAQAHSVEEIITRRAELKGKTVSVRGMVVKYNPNIMGRNWVHIRDGSGSDAKQTDDLLVTTTDRTKLGDVITARGIVRTDKDFGAGYFYKVLVENATLQNK